jgi:hypothetical protein
MKRTLIVIGLLLLVAAGAWKFALSPRYEQRFPPGWSWEYNSLGYTAYADEATGQFPEGTTLADSPINVTVRTINAAATDNPGQVTITDRFESRNASTNIVEWEFTAEAVVDAATGQIADGELAGSYFFIPTNAQKITYTVSNVSYRNIPMAFQTEETILGVNTYKYAFYGDLDNKVSYTSYVEFADNEEVYCFDYQMEYWVEPITGEMVKYREWCEGDWVVDAATGDRLYALQRWGTESSGDDLIRSVSDVKSRLNTYRWMTQYIPMLLAVAGVIALGAVFMPGLLLDKSEGKRTV